MLDRRKVLKSAGVAAAALTAGGGSQMGLAKESAGIHFDNGYFYGAGGKFKEEAAKDAYVALMKYHKYPVFADVREKLWVSDYGTGEFAKLGIGAVFFVNNEEHRYMMLDIYLLPGQMLPEHYHLATAKNPAKLEGWLCRHGVSYVYGAGEPTENIKAVIPKCHMGGKVTVRHETILRPGQFTGLKAAEERHWQFGGPEGAILTEVANVHDGDGVRHSDTNLVFG